MNFDNKYDYLDFKPYTLDELKDEMRQDLEAVDKMVEAAEKYVAECIKQETEKQRALAKRIRQTTGKHRVRKR